jgi:hypothetical protein
MSANLCFARLIGALLVPQTIEISGNAGSRHHSLLLLPYAKFRFRGIRSCRHGQPMSLKQSLDGKSTSFE